MSTNTKIQNDDCYSNCLLFVWGFKLDFLSIYLSALLKYTYIHLIDRQLDLLLRWSLLWMVQFIGGGKFEWMNRKKSAQCSQSIPKFTLKSKQTTCVHCFHHYHHHYHYHNCCWKVGGTYMPLSVPQTYIYVQTMTGENRIEQTTVIIIIVIVISLSRAFCFVDDTCLVTVATEENESDWTDPVDHCSSMLVGVFFFIYYYYYYVDVDVYVFLFLFL